MAIKCPKCNADNPDTSRFCADCGTQIVSIKGASVTKTIQEPIVSSGKIIAGKYKIQDELGRGGMGVVYKAKDTRLNRTVALKFLPAELTQDKEARKRFIQEAQAAAALEHPNICSVYEVDEADGQTFIAMSYIEGQSLKDKLKEGPLDVDEAKGLAIQVAEGLKEAHEKGIVHRDIKPANIMFTKKGQAKITDFGLAKLSWGLDLTKPATIMGTVSYMSPEQAKGDEVDHRTDIWSLGAILYEMLSGKRPFQKAQEQALIYSILNDKPTPISLIRSDIPAHIEQVIEKALAKKVSKRYQDIQKLIQDLELSISPPKTEKSIVVLPFEDMSPGKDNEYFSDGLTEEIISDLSLIHDLLVISRSSAMTYKGTKKKIKEIGQELNVQYVLEGSVRKAGNNLRITAQLIDAEKDVHLWAEKYSGALDDVFEIQEKVSRSIVDKLKIKLSPEEDKRFGRSSIGNLKAYEYYLMARNQIWLFSEESLDRALNFVERGLEIIGDNDLLLTMQGLVYMQYVNTLSKDPETYPDLLEKAKQKAKKALALNPASGQAHFLLGSVGMNTANPHNMVRHYQKALKLDPNYADTVFVMGYIRAAGGWDIEGARKYMEKGAQLDPFSPLTKTGMLWIYWFKGEFQKSVDEAQDWRRALEDANSAFLVFIAWLNAYAGNHEEAFRLIDWTIEGNPDHTFSSAAAALKYALQGVKDKAIGAITDKLKNAAWWDDAWPLLMADIYALLGEPNLVFHWLERAIDSGIANVHFLMSNPFMVKLHNNKRFQRLIEKASGLSEALGETAKASEKEDFIL